LSVINKVERLVKLERILYSLPNDKDCSWLHLRCLCRNFPFQNFETRNIIWTFWILLQLGKWALERQANINNKITCKFNVYNYMYCLSIFFLCFVSQHFLYETFFTFFSKNQYFNIPRTCVNPSKLFGNFAKFYSVKPILLCIIYFQTSSMIDSDTAISHFNRKK